MSPNPWSEDPFRGDAESSSDQQRCNKSTSSYPLSRLQIYTEVTELNPSPLASSEDVGLKSNHKAADQVTQQHTLLYHIKPWAAELVFSFLSVLVFVVLIAILSRFDNKPMPTWPSGLTLNTLAAVLATICRGMTIIPVTEGISQLKWNWFSTQQRSVRDLYLFDQASRGLWAFFPLIPRTRGRYTLFTALAAIVLSFGLATSFLTQSSIGYKERLIQRMGESVAAPAARNFPDPMTDPSVSGDKLLEGLVSAGIQAAFSTESTWLDPTPQCPSGDCRWPPFSSLAVCAKMINVTARLESDETGSTLSLPGGIAKFPFEISSNSTSSSILPSTTSSKTLPTSLPAVLLPDYVGYTPEETNLNFTCWDVNKDPSKVLTFGSWNIPDLFNAGITQYFLVYEAPGGAPRAVEAALHFCVNEYNVSVSNGNSNTNLLSSTLRVSSPGKNGVYDLESIDGSDTIRVDREAGHSIVIAEQLCKGLKENSLLKRRLGFVLKEGLSEELTSEEKDAKAWSNLQLFFTRIASSVTAYMRDMDKNHTIVGEVFETRTYVEIRWEWLAFLAAQIGLTILFLVLVIIHTSRSSLDIVKSSNTAELLALDGGHTEGMGIGSKLDNKAMARLINENSTTWKLKISQ